MGTEKNNWREVKTSQKFSNAFRGVSIFAMTTKYLIAHKLAALLVIGLGFYFGISKFEWIAIVFAIGFDYGLSNVVQKNSEYLIRNDGKAVEQQFIQHGVTLTVGVLF